MRRAVLGSAACLALLLGSLVYLMERDAAHVALMPAAATLPIGPVFGALGQWLPSFVHPFSFSLLWAAARPPEAPPAYGACAGWWAVNVLFEIGQHPNLNVPLAGFVKDTFGDGRATQMLMGYFLRGTFDRGDIVAATAGAMAAAALLMLVCRKAESNAR